MLSTHFSDWLLSVMRYIFFSVLLYLLCFFLVFVVYMCFFFSLSFHFFFFFFFFQAEDGIRDADVTGVQTCALPISVLTGTDTSDITSPVAARWLPMPGKAW